MVKSLIDKLKKWVGHTTIVPIEKNGLRCTFVKERNGVRETDTVDLVRNFGHKDTIPMIKPLYYRWNDNGEWSFDFKTFHRENRQTHIEIIKK